MIKPIQLMIVGAQKSGTSSLLKYLTQHPNIHTHKKVPEYIFFVNNEQYNEGYPKTFLRYFGECPNNEVLVLAKNAMLMYAEEAVTRLRQHNPDIQLIVMLRAPVNRAYSAYWYARRTGWEKLKTFEEALEAEATRLEEGWLKWHDCCYVHNSIYYPHIKRLFDQFSRDQIKIIFAEDLREQSVQLCREIFTKLNLASDFPIETKKIYNQSGIPRSEFFSQILHKLSFSSNPAVATLLKSVPQSFKSQTKKMILNLNNKPFTPPPINPNTKAHLIDQFRLPNQQLSELLELDLSHWEYE